MFCSNCGNQIDENAKFCINCGAAQNTPVVPSVQDNPQPVEVQETAPVQESAPVQQPVQAPVQQPIQAPVQETAPIQQTAPVQTVATQKQPKNKKLLPIVAIAAVAVIAIIVGIFVLGGGEGILPPSYSEGLEFRSNGDGTCA